MKVYLASWYASRPEMKLRAEELRATGIEVTSRWVEEHTSTTATTAEVGDDYLRETAAIDLEDVMKANVVVLHVPSEHDLRTVNITMANWARGGRHFEAGAQYMMMLLFNYLPYTIQKVGPRSLILIGHRENVFHYFDGVNKSLKALGFDLPEIPVFSTWEEAKVYLAELSQATQPLYASN